MVRAAIAAPSGAVPFGDFLAPTVIFASRDAAVVKLECQAILFALDLCPTFNKQRR
jgi:hypothetical protein